MAMSSLVPFVLLITTAYANPDANRLFEDLLSDYNKLVRPVPFEC